MDEAHAKRGSQSTPSANPFPDARTVLDQGFDFRPKWWRDRTPAAWSTFLSELPLASQGRGYHHITRADLISLGREDSSDANGALLVACYAWGTGNAAFLAPRRARVFRDTPTDELAARLTDARRLLKTHGAAAAYQSLTDGGPNRSKHMGASFFTKFLYAVAAPGIGTHGGDGSDPRPVRGHRTERTARLESSEAWSLVSRHLSALDRTRRREGCRSIRDRWLPGPSGRS